jgi:hypothetical protein
MNPSTPSRLPLVEPPLPPAGEREPRSASDPGPPHQLERLRPLSRPIADRPVEDR